MAADEKPTPRAEPKRPSPMMSVEPSMREGIEALTPRWLKRLLSRGRS
jgi:hypothetical protein